MAEEDPDGNGEKTPMSFKDKLKLFEQKEHVYDKLDNKNRTGPYSKLVPTKTDSGDTNSSKLSEHPELGTDQESQIKTGSSRPSDGADSVHSRPHDGNASGQSRSRVNSDYFGSDEYMGGADFLEPRIGLNNPRTGLTNETKEMYEKRIQNKQSNPLSSEQPKLQPAETASKPPPLPPRPTKTSLSSTYTIIDDVMINTSQQSGSSNISNTSYRSDNGDGGTVNEKESSSTNNEVPPLPLKSYLTGPRTPGNMSSSERSDNSDCKGSDEYRGSTPVSPGPYINQTSQSPNQRTDKEPQQEDQPHLSPREGDVSSGPSSKGPGAAAFPQDKIKQQKIEPKTVEPPFIRETPRGHGTPAYCNHPSQHGSPESHGLPGKGHGGQAYNTDRDNLNSDIGKSGAVPLFTDQNTGMQHGGPPPMYSQTSGPMAYGPTPGPFYPGHQQPRFRPDHQQLYQENYNPAMPPFGYPQQHFNPQLWQHGQHLYGPTNGRQSPDWQQFHHWPQNPQVAAHVPPNVSRSQSPLTASHSQQSHASRSQSPHQVSQNLPSNASMSRKEDKHVDIGKFKLSVINDVCEMGYKYDQVKNTVEKIFSDKENHEQSEERIVGKVLDMLLTEQPPAPRKTDIKAKKGPEKLEKPKTDSKGKQPLKKESPVKDKGLETTYICIKGLEERHLNDINKREKFCNFLDKLVEEDVDRSALFYGGDELAIVAFLGDPDIGFLSRELKKRHYEGVYINICEVDPPRSIVVSGASDSIPTKDVKNYFQNHHQSGGGHVESCDEEDGVYVVCFKSHTDVENVCQGTRRHKIGSTTLYVSPRFECQFGNIWDMSKHKAVLPTEITVTWLDHHLSMFIMSSSTCCDKFNLQIQPDYAEICSSLGADNLCIKCLLTQSTPNIRKLSKSWLSNVRQKLDELVAGLVDKKEIMCSSAVWESFKETLKALKDEDSSEFMIVEDDENFCVVIVGMKRVVQSQYDKVLSQKQKMEVELERKTQIKTETKRFNPGQIMLLKNDGVFIEVNNIAEDLEVVVIDTENGEIQFTGIEEDIKKAQVKIYEFLNEKIPTDITGISEQQSKLIKNESNMKLIQGQLEDRNIKANIVVSGEKLQVVSSSGEDNSRAEQIVKNFTKESIINLGDDAVTVLSKDAWTHKLADIDQKYPQQVLISVAGDGTVTLTTAANIHNGVHSELKTLIDQHATHLECIEVEKEGNYTFLLQYTMEDFERLQNDLKMESVQITLVKDGIEISGTSSGIKLAKSKVSDVIKGIREKKIVLKGPGIGHVLCHDNMERLCMISDQTRTVILLEESDDNEEDTVQQASGSTNSVKCKHGISVSIIEDDIANAKADVLVCTTSTDLNLSSGKACRSLLNAAGGHTLQKNCNTKYPQGINEGEIASVKGGNLHCKKVYFGALPQWKPRENQPLKIIFKFMQDCLTKAEKAGFTSLAFLALGTGASGYPATNVAEVMYSCITDYDKHHHKSKIKAVGFVVHHSDNTTLKAFKAEEDKIRAGTDHVGIKCKNGTQIQLVTGELAKEEGDVIVCGTSHDLNLSAGKASGNLLHVGGQNLQKECKKNYPEGIEPDQIAVVKGGKLKCQEVYFGWLPEWKTEQSKPHKTLWKFVESCMLKAHESGYSTIVFPALGTGALGYPADRAAHLMFDSVIKFDHCYSRSNVNNVKFVLYHKDQPTLKGFQQKEKEILRLSQTGAQGNWGRGQTKVQATVTIGQIEKRKVDVIICCTGPKLDLSQGKITQALVNAGGTALQADCNKNYLSGIQNEDIADIGPGNLPCKRVYLGVLPKYGTDKQTAEQALHKFVSKCMYKASKAGYSSISVPAVGTGKYNQYPHHVVASVIFGAVDRFDRKNHVTSLKEVCCVAVKNDKKSCQAFKMEERKRYVPSVTRATRQRFYQGRTHGATQDTSGKNEVSLFIYSDSDENIQKAEQQIDQYCQSKITERTIKDEMIQHLPRQEQLAIENLGRLHPIRLEIKKHKNEIILEGRTEDLLQVKDEINKILSELEKDHHSEKEARILAEKIQWHFKERQVDGVKLIPYSSRINLKLERAFKEKNMKVVEFLSNDGTVHKVDFKKMQEYPAHNTADRVDVVRREKIAASTFPLPKEWSDMGDTEQYKEVELNSSSKEYKDVEKLFKDSVFQGKFQGSYSQSTFSILKIIRIQNKYLYQQFEAKKNQLQHQNPTTTKNEQTLWHGTGSAAISSINYNGFNRSYCATANDAWYGNGVYFANDAGYSCADWASKPDASGIKYMYMVRVLTGVYCQGVKGMRVLPVRTGNILYDSAVETTNSPTEFIIFHDTQAYPQYMIHFKK